MTPADEHRRAFDALGAYALGALTDGERADVDVHLEACPLCVEELDRLGAVTDALSRGTAPLQAPRELRDRIMAVVDREAELLRATGVVADRAEVRRPRWSVGVRRATLGLAATACVALGLAAGTALQGGGDIEPAVSVQADVLDERVPTATASLVGGEESATLHVEGLRNPPEGRVYQVWLKRPGRPPDPTDALFTVNDRGQGSVSVPGLRPGVREILVTDEPQGGSTVPSRSPVIRAVLPAST